MQRSVCSDKRNPNVALAREAETAVNSNDYVTVYRIAKKLAGFVRDVNGSFLIHNDEQLERCVKCGHRMLIPNRSELVFAISAIKRSNTAGLDDLL